MKTHPLNVSYLVVGLVFLGIAGSWALRAADLVNPGQLDWLFPLTLVVAGVVGLVAFASRGRRGRGRDETVPGGVDPEIADLEATAYAPYHTDIERTRILEAGQTSQSTGQSISQPTTDQKEQGDNR